jgi:hypothetical protein
MAKWSSIPARSPCGRALLVAVALAAASVPSVAAAQITPRHRTVVLRFEGWRAEQARRGAIAALRAAYDLVDEQTLIDTAGRIGVDVGTPEGMAAVVENLGVEIVLGGFVEGRGRTATTTVWVMDVRGNELARQVTSAPVDRRAEGDIGNAARAIADSAILQLAPPAVVEPPPEEVHEAPPDHEEAPVDVSGRWNQPYVRALAGVRIRNRTVVVRPMENVTRFDAGFYPDIQLAVEVRPFARSPDALRGLYASLAGGFSAGLSYFRVDDQQRDLQNGNLEFALGYGIIIEEIVELVLAAGVGFEAYVLADRTRLPSGIEDFPSTLYSYVRPAVQARFRLVPASLLLLELGFGGRIGWDLGELSGYGATSSFGGGIDFYLGLAGALDFGLSWAARFAYGAWFLSFGGDPLFAESGMDEAIQILLLVGWSF